MGNDGEWNGKQYFTCSSGHGMFCAFENLSPVPSGSYPNPPHSPEPHAPYISHATTESQQGPLSAAAAGPDDNRKTGRTPLNFNTEFSIYNQL